MKLNAKAWGDYNNPPFASGKLQTPDTQEKRVTLVADGAVDHAVWGELLKANPDLGDQFVSSLHDPRFTDYGRGAEETSLGDGWTSEEDDTGSYMRLGNESAHQRFYFGPKLVTLTPTFTHTMEGRSNYDGMDPTSPEEQLEIKAPEGSSFIANEPA